MVKIICTGAITFEGLLKIINITTQ